MLQADGGFHLSPAFLAGVSAVLAGGALLVKVIPGAFRSGNGARTSERTLVLVEQQQKELHELVRVVSDQQLAATEGRTILEEISTALQGVARSLERSVAHLTAISANVEHAQLDLAEHRRASEQAVQQVAEIHTHFMRGRRP